MSTDAVRAALAELVAATNPDGETSVADWRKAWAAARAALSEPAPGVVDERTANSDSVDLAAAPKQRGELPEPVAKIHSDGCFPEGGAMTEKGASPLLVRLLLDAWTARANLSETVNGQDRLSDAIARTRASAEQLGETIQEWNSKFNKEGKT